jgi:hypothetical protein
VQIQSLSPPSSDFEFLIPVSPSSDPFVSISKDKNASNDSDGELEPSSWESTPVDGPGQKFEPTVPQSLSGSPTKPKLAPLDPQWPLIGMCFGTLEEAVHFAYEYEGCRGYEWKKCESQRNKQGELCLHLLYGY